MHFYFRDTLVAARPALSYNAVDSEIAAHVNLHPLTRSRSAAASFCCGPRPCRVQHRPGMTRANCISSTVSRVRPRRLRRVRGDDRRVLVLARPAVGARGRACGGLERAREAGGAHFRGLETEDFEFGYLQIILRKLSKCQISAAQDTSKVFRS